VIADPRPAAVDVPLPDPTTVLLAVPNPLLRRALGEELAHHGPCTILEACSTGDTARVAADHGPGDLAVLHLGVAGADDEATTVRLVRTLRDGGWDHVVALGDRGRLAHIGATLQAGARAYLFTGQSPLAGPGNGLPEKGLPESGAPDSGVPDGGVVDGAIPDGGLPGGGIPGPRPPVDDVPRRVRVRDADGGQRELSHREVQVLRLAADGLGNAEIGQVLGLSALTVKSHLARISHRLHARDRAHMVLLAMRAGAVH
jgi:DNA-binding NarL/FixJ family response regulator